MILVIILAVVQLRVLILSILRCACTDCDRMTLARVSEDVQAMICGSRCAEGDVQCVAALPKDGGGLVHPTAVDTNETLALDCHLGHLAAVDELTRSERLEHDDGAARRHGCAAAQR